MRAVPSAASAKKPSPLNSEIMHPSKEWGKNFQQFFSAPFFCNIPSDFSSATRFGKSDTLIACSQPPTVP